jgi:hypothetical protein
MSCLSWMVQVQRHACQSSPTRHWSSRLVQHGRASYTWNVGSILLSCQQGPAPGAHRHLIDTYTVVCAHHLAPFFIWVTVELLSVLNARSLCWLHGEQVVCAGHGLVGWHGCLQLLIQKYTKRRLVFPLYFFLPSFLLSFFKRKK